MHADLDQGYHQISTVIDMLRTDICVDLYDQLRTSAGLLGIHRTSGI